MQVFSSLCSYPDRLTIIAVTVQPFRSEINRVIATYLAKSAPRELNVSSRDRTAVLRALANTTHPSAFRLISASVECSLRRQAHPNFIRWTICNGNRPRVLFARGLGVGTIMVGFVIATLLTISGAGRGWRALAALGWFIGVATLVAAWKGMCVVCYFWSNRLPAARTGLMTAGSPRVTSPSSPAVGTFRRRRRSKLRL